MVVRNSLYGLAATLVIKILSFSFTIFVVRQLGSDQYGKYLVATAFVGIFMVFSDLGIGSYVAREVARDGNNVEKLLGNMMGLRFTLALFFIAFATSLAWLVGYPSDIILAVFLGSSSQLLFAVQSTFDAVLLGKQKIGASALAAVANQLVLISTGTVILLLGFGFIGLSVATLLGILAATLINSTTVRQRMGHHTLIVTPRIWPTLLKRGLPFGINQFALSVTYRLDSLMLGWFWSTSTVGQYGAAYNLIFTLATISNSICLSLFPHMSNEFARDPQAARRNFGRYLRFLLILALPMAAIGSVLAEPLTHLLFSNKYPESATALRILVWVLPLMFLNELLGYIAATLGLEKQMATLRMVNAASNLAMNAVAIPFFGIVGASLTTVLTEAVGIIQFIWLFRQQQVFPSSPVWLLKPGLAALAAAVFAWIFSSFPVLLVGAGALGIYGAGLLLTGAIEKSELGAFRAAFTRKSKVSLPPVIETEPEPILKIEQVS